jgi:hypothetical protein
MVEETAALIEWLDEAFRGPAWHGPSLLSSLRGVSPRDALWRPSNGRHNIAEIVAHAAYWKHIVRQRITGGRERFALRGRNWFTLDSAGEWRVAVRLLVGEHARLRAAAAGLGRRDWARIVHARQTARQCVRGVAAHDVYHAGQIRLLQKLAAARRTSARY